MGNERLDGQSKFAFMLGDQGYLTELNQVAEVIPWPGVTLVPWTQPWFKGVANVRGRVVGVVDIHGILYGRLMLSQQSLQLLVLGDHLRYSVGLLISRALGLRNMMDFISQAGAAQLPYDWIGASWRDSGGQEFREFDATRFVDSRVFDNLEL